MITKYKHKPTIPYSLHDMVVNKITHDEDAIHLRFAHGYVRFKEPYQQVGGKITIQGVDFDYVAVMLLNKNGAYGDFKGYKLSLDEFLKKYDTYEFEIVDEMYGYNSVEYGGFLSVPHQNDFTEMTLSICHFGDIVYETDE